MFQTLRRSIERFHDRCIRFDNPRRRSSRNRDTETFFAGDSNREIALSVAAFFFLLVVTSSPALAASTAGIDAISAYAGTWKSQIESLDTPHSKADHEETSLRNDCWKSGGYFACNQYVNGESKVLIVFTCDSAGHACTSYQVPPDGSEPGSGKLLIDGNTWIFPWQQTEHGKTTYYRVVNVFKSPTQIEYRREFSPDKTNWTIMARGNEVKLK